jgi:non-homologous end joining protein Ku
MGVIEAKRSGEGVKQVVTAEKAPAPDLLAALQASLDEARGPGKAKPAAKRPAKKAKSA